MGDNKVHSNPFSFLRRGPAAPLCAGFALIAAAALPAACASNGAQSGDDASLAAPPSAERGLAFARANCGACHAVTPDQETSPRAGAPTFYALANNPAVTPLSFDVLLQTPHANMPNLMVSPREREDLWAHLLTLRQTP